MPKKVIKKHAGGRPTKYKPEYCEKIVKYFKDFEMFDEIPVEKQNSDGSVTTTMKKIASLPPSVTKFATSIGVSHDTIQEWRKVHPEFSVSYSKAKKIYEDIIRDGAMIGLYKENFTKMVMSYNFNWSDKVQTQTEIKFENLTDEELQQKLKDLDVDGTLG